MPRRRIGISATILSVPGERIAVLSTPRVEFLVAWLAALRVGLVYVGLNPRYTYRELAHVIGDAKPSAIVLCCGKRPCQMLAICLGSASFSPPHT